MENKGDAWSGFARNVMLARYSHKDASGNPTESWEDIAKRVVNAVIPRKFSELRREMYRLISLRKFIPGGRYLYAAGRPFHPVNNCFGGNETLLTSKGVFSFKELKDKKVHIRNWKGGTEEAEIRHFGKQQIYKMHLSNGDTFDVTKDHLWIQPDGSRLKTTEVKRVMLSQVDNFPVPSREGIRHGIIYGDGYKHPHTGHTEIVFVNPQKDESLVEYFDQHDVRIVGGFGAATTYKTIRKTKAGTKVGLQPGHYKTLPYQYSPEYARGFIAGLIATDGCVSKSGSVLISCEGFNKAVEIRKIAVAAGCVVSSVRVASKVNPYTGGPRELCNVYIKPFSAPIILPSHLANIAGRKTRKREMYLDVVEVYPTTLYQDVYCAVVPGTHTFTLGNGVLTSNCFLYRAEDSREGWSDLLRKSSMSLMTGGGVGVEYSNVREEGRVIHKTGGVASGPLSLLQMINEMGRHILQGGNRRSAIWGGLNWNHPDIDKFIKLKVWPEWLRTKKAQDFNTPAPLDMTNISVGLDREFFDAFNGGSTQAANTYYEACYNMFKWSEPGFSINYSNPLESLRNACSEVTSSDDSDCCNLGSINLARIDSLEELALAVECTTAFLLFGSIYSDVPHPEVAEVRDRNRRVGLGLMGLHEWLIKRGYQYKPNEELEAWLSVYESGSIASAEEWAHKLSISSPVALRAVAPTGTIGIIGETTTGIEPIYAKAFKRRYLSNGKDWVYEYVVDPTAKRLANELGINEDDIEDAHSLQRNMSGFRSRLDLQVTLQKYVDQGISSTINLPAWGSETNNDSNWRERADILYPYLPHLRGITCYADGSRGGQPLTPVKISTAEKHEGQVFEEAVDICEISGKGGSCGV